MHTPPLLLTTSHFNPITGCSVICLPISYLTCRMKQDSFFVHTYSIPHSPLLFIHTHPTPRHILIQ